MPNLFKLVAMACLFTRFLFAESSPNSRPNFIVILVDDLGWMDLSCQGSDYYKTPHIDNLAKSGMRFTNAYAACAVCSPTRAALQTGRYPARIGITDWIRSRFQRGGNLQTPRKPVEYVGDENRRLLCPPNPFWMETDEITIAEALREKGYKTAHIGKWHLGDEAWYPENQGYDQNFGGCDYGQPPSYFDPFRRPNHKHPMIRSGIPHLPARQKGQYLTDREADEAVDLIRKWNAQNDSENQNEQTFDSENNDQKSQPFFLHLAHYAVHTPIQAIEADAQKYRQPNKTEMNAKYAAMVESIDRSTGRIVAVLEELGIAENTMIIFTSDNGGLDRNGNPTENAPLRSGKGYAYEGGIRVPFIAKWQGVIPPNSVSDEPISSIDIFPTILESAKMPLPNHVLDGVSLVSHFSSGGKIKLERDALIWHFPHYRHEPGPYSIIRRGEWKLIQFYEGSRELYDLEKDLGETQNLAAHHPILAASLEAELARKLKEMGALLPRPNPNFKAP